MLPIFFDKNVSLLAMGLVFAQQNMVMEFPLHSTMFVTLSHGFVSWITLPRS